MTSPLDHLERWYLSNCHGNWEHTYGVRIETLDNPGWDIEIDLADTSLEHRSFEVARIERSVNDWYSCGVENKKFKAACGPTNLAEAITIFVQWASSP